MSEYLINKYLSHLNSDFVENIKLLYVFDDNHLNKNILIVTNNDKVFGFGPNYDGILGFGHNNEVIEPEIIKELCNKKIIDFYNGIAHCLALSSTGSVYSFGDNQYYQLGYYRKFEDNNKPKLIEGLRYENVKHICCGGYHTLVLTQNDEVFGWGDNSWGQIGINSEQQIQSVPIIIDGFNGEKIQTISAGNTHSIALTANGNVFIWGRINFLPSGNNSREESRFPYMIENEDVNIIFVKISCGYAHSLLLSSNGDIYSFGSNFNKQLGIDLPLNKNRKFNIFKIESKEIFKDIRCSFNKSISTAMTSDNNCYIWGKCGQKIVNFLTHTQYSSCEDAIIYKENITVNAINLSFYETDLVKQFIISFGGFGIVSKIYDKKDRKYYALKRIAFNQQTKDKVMRETKLLRDLKSDYVVHVKSIWTGNNYLLDQNKHELQQICAFADSHELFKPKNNLLLHIKMELCYKTLHEILIQIRKELNEEIHTIKSLLSFYISCELLIEILESVEFLHSRIPKPVIHRDLKPSNILITHGINGRFVKLGDFGLSKEIESYSQSNTSKVGTLRYRAPEIFAGRKYSTKADVYSLGAFVSEIFNFDINELNTDLIENGRIKQVYEELYRIQLQMTSIRMNDRVDCTQVLDKSSRWSINLKEIKTNKQFKSMINKFDNNIKNNFCSFFCTKKLEAVTGI